MRSDRVHKGKLFGMAELDEVIGEVPPNYVVLIEGEPGTGKTSFALLTACRNVSEGRGKVLYLTFNEDRDKLIYVARSVGCDLEGLIAKGLIKVIEYPTIADEYIIETLSQELVSHVDRGFDLIVIDSIVPVIKILESYSRKRAWLHTVLYKVASARKAVLLLVGDLLQKEDPDIALIEYLADAVIKFTLNPGTIFSRSMQVMKFRGRKVEAFPIYFRITGNGLLPINIVRPEEAESIARVKKSLRIEEEPAVKLFGKELRPGTQASIIIRYPATTLGLLHKYLVLKLGLDALREGIKVGLICYTLSSERSKESYRLSEEKILSDLMGENFVFMPLEIQETVQRPYLTSGIAYQKKVDLLIVTGYERIAEVYGLKETNKLLLSYSSMDAKIGLTTLRFFRTSSTLNEPPSSMLTLSDIIVEAYLGRDGQLLYKGIKGRHITRPTLVPEKEFEEPVSSLEESLRYTLSAAGHTATH